MHMNYYSTRNKSVKTFISTITVFKGNIMQVINLSHICNLKCSRNNIQKEKETGK